MLPNFFVIGAQKAGTTALYYYLRRHPEIYMSPVKEPQHFAPDLAGPTTGPGDRPARRFQTLDAYQGLFDGVSGQLAVGEASVSYLYSSEAAGRIADLLPEARLIAVLRNPVDRAYSNFLHLVRDGREPLRDFEQALAAEDERRRQGWSANWHYRAKGFYGSQIRRYLSAFPPEQLRLYLYDDFEQQADQVVADVYGFLGVDPGFRQDLSLRLNVAGIPRRRRLHRLLMRAQRLKWAASAVAPAAVRRRALELQNRNLERPQISPALRRQLLAVYRDDLIELERMTGLGVSRWLTEDPRRD
jgi:hypothetical protein